VRGFILLIAAVVACFVDLGSAMAAGRLVIDGAWIRTPPPGAQMLAGYAQLRNDGDTPLTIRGVSGDDFGSVALHETITIDGVERMRRLPEWTLAPGAGVSLAPGGKHLMLMQPKRALAPGARTRIRFFTTSGAEVTAEFVVGDAAP
jgi:hypothetical protein